MKVCIDPGHGGEDSGAVGVSNGYFESHGVLDIGLRLRELLLPHMEVMMTRDTDEFVSLSQRCKVANNDPAGVDVFVSIHLNSADTDASGWEVFTSGSTKSRELANDIGYRQAECFPLQKNRGVKQEGFYVLRNTKMPAVLWEGCFLSNYEESKWVTEDDTRQAMAVSICLGVLDYFNITTANQQTTLEERVTKIERHLGL